MLDKLAKRLLQPINTSLALLIGVYNLLTGLWLCLPFNSIENILETYGTEEHQLGIWLIIVGLITSVAVIASKYEYLLIGSFLSFVTWLAALILLLFSNIAGVGWITALVISGYCGMIFINLRVNRELYDK